MSADVTILNTIKSQTLQLIADLTAEPKPTYSVDEQSVSWHQYLAQLRATVAWCDAKLNDAEPFEFQSRGGT